MFIEKEGIEDIEGTRVYHSRVYILWSRLNEWFIRVFQNHSIEISDIPIRIVEGR